MPSEDRIIKKDYYKDIIYLKKGVRILKIHKFQMKMKFISKAHDINTSI